MSKNLKRYYCFKGILNESQLNDLSEELSKCTVIEDIINVVKKALENEIFSEKTVQDTETIKETNQKTPNSSPDIRHKLISELKSKKLI